MSDGCTNFESCYLICMLVILGWLYAEGYRVLHNSLPFSFSKNLCVGMFVVSECDPVTFVSSANTSRNDPQQALL
jgi:hypothetical protein